MADMLLRRNKITRDILGDNNCVCKLHTQKMKDFRFTYILILIYKTQSQRYMSHPQFYFKIIFFQLLKVNSIKIKKRKLEPVSITQKLLDKKIYQSESNLSEWLQRLHQIIRIPVIVNIQLIARIQPYLFIQMNNLIAQAKLSPRFIKTAKTIVAVFTGCWLGTLWGKIEWAGREDWCNDNNITKYECEDQINQLIETHKKPAVIYYYLPASPHHFLYRSYMYKYSNMYPENAIWFMVNLTQHLQPAKQALRSIVFPTPSTRIEVRYPKTQIAIFQEEKQGLKLIKEDIGNRREVYKYGYFQNQFQAFLEENKVMLGADPLAATLKITEKALFE